MARSFNDIMGDWCRSLTKGQRVEIDRLGLQGLLGLKSFTFDWEFSRALPRYWDPVVHCFRFEGAFESDELVPLPEEFGAILGVHRDRLPVIPTVKKDYSEDFIRFFNLKGDKLSEIVVENRVRMVDFALYFSDRSLPHSYVVYKRRAFVFCMFSMMLLINGENNYLAPASLVSIVEQVEAGRDPSHVIVAETMMGLDALKKGPCAKMKGSPIILQVWLMEHLSLLLDPNADQFINPGAISRRKRRYTKPKSYHEWDKFLISRDFQIRWVVAWWQTSAITLSSTTSYVRLPSLTHLTFYYPCLAMRQYGQDQVIPEKKIKYPREFLLTPEYAKRFEGLWEKRATLGVLKFAEHRGPPSKEYSEWLQDRIANDPGLPPEPEAEWVPDKKLPIKKRLGSIIRPKDPKETAKKTHVSGKGKEKVIEEPKKKKLRKTWQPKEVGESSKVKVRTENGSLLVQEDSEDADKDKDVNPKRVKKN